MGLNIKQQLVLKKAIEGKNLYVSGPGGHGKSYLIEYIMDKLGESTVLMAPTGIAALNVAGSTIHSSFKFPFSVLWKREHSQIKDKTRDLFDKNGPVKRIIIDEISMVRADILYAIDMQLRKIRRLNIPFGGLQVILVGDFYQLPPVLTNREERIFKDHFDTVFSFGIESWSGAGFEYIELDENMRQSESTFINHLMAIRSKKPGFEESVKFFNKIGTENKESVLDNDPVFLCSTNRATSTINEMNYQDLDGEERVFIAKKTGKFSATPSPEELCLKFGTKIIFTANTEDFKNGQTGYVIGFIGDKVEVLLEETETKVIVEKHKWEELEYGTGKDGGLIHYPVGSYVQYPMKHGWSVTIHKAQGQTLPNGIIDLGNGAFCHGQTYVAISRMKTLSGFALFNPMKSSDIIVSKEIHEFYDNDCRGIGLF